MKRRSKIFFIVMSVIAVAVVAIFFAANKLVEQRLLSELRARGFNDVHLRVAHVGLHSTKLDQISLGNFPVAFSNLTIDYSLSPASLHGSSPNLEFKTPSFEAKSGAASLDLKPTGDGWGGTWSFKDISLKNFETPTLAAEGTIHATSETITIDGTLSSADRSYRAKFHFEHFPGTPERSLFTLNNARIPLQGGNVSVATVEVPVYNRPAIKTRLIVQSISLDSVLQAFTGKHANATGIVSGVIPVTLNADNSITFDHGTLQAEAPGTIILSPDAIPGDNEQVTLLREVLKNFHYKALLIGINSDNDKKLAALFVLEGNNPDLYDGRPVKLNVHLGGDVLDFVQQNVLAITNPQQLLRQ